MARSKRGEKTLKQPKHRLKRLFESKANLDADIQNQQQRVNNLVEFKAKLDSKRHKLRPQKKLMPTPKRKRTKHDLEVCDEQIKEELWKEVKIAEDKWREAAFKNSPDRYCLLQIAKMKLSAYAKAADNETIDWINPNFLVGDEHQGSSTSSGVQSEMANSSGSAFVCVDRPQKTIPQPLQKKQPEQDAEQGAKPEAEHAKPEAQEQQLL